MHVEFVCVANYCRSPVAESFFKKMATDIEVSSSGIKPYQLAKMDDRSAQFLADNGIHPSAHLPRELKQKKREPNDLIICFELSIIHFIWKKYPSQRDHLKIYNYLDPSIKINDPFKLKTHDEYYSEMNNIKTCVNLWVKNIDSK